MPGVDLNYWAILAAAIINMAVGAVWYSNALFAKQWVKLTGRKMEDMRGASPGYLVAAVGALVQAFILAHFVRYAGAVTFADGLITGFWLWLGFTAITTAVNGLFAGRPWKLWQIDAGYFLVVLVINGGLLAVWR